MPQVQDPSALRTGPCYHSAGLPTLEDTSHLSLGKGAQALGASAVMGVLLGFLPGLANGCWCISRRAWPRAAYFLVAQTYSLSCTSSPGVWQGRLRLRPTAALSHRQQARRLHAAALVDDSAAPDACDERFMTIALEEAQLVCVTWQTVRLGSHRLTLL